MEPIDVSFLIELIENNTAYKTRFQSPFILKFWIYYPVAFLWNSSEDLSQQQIENNNYNAAALFKGLYFSQWMMTTNWTSLLNFLEFTKILKHSIESKILLFWL